MVFIRLKKPNDRMDDFIVLPHNFNLNDFRNACHKVGDLINYRLLIEDKQLCLDNENIFNRQKNLITNGVEILLLPRAPGGTFIEISLLKEILLEELKIELNKLNRIMKECSICTCEELCVQIHCISVCVDCFPNYLQETNFRLRCIQEKEDEELRRLLHFQKAPKTHPCGEEIDYRVLFKTTEFIDKWSVLCDVMQLITNIDCQICYCGALLFNMTMYSKQQCTNCRRWLCFFCNKNWNDYSMMNKKYTCENIDCEYQRRLIYELVPLGGSDRAMIPNRRCCPKCFNVGGYGEKCQYHCCPHCKHRFCFICLRPEDECKIGFRSANPSKCELAEQNYLMFPRVCDST